MNLDEKIDQVIRFYGASIRLKTGFNERYCRRAVKETILEEIEKLLLQKKLAVNIFSDVRKLLEDK